VRLCQEETEMYIPAEEVQRLEAESARQNI